MRKHFLLALVLICMWNSVKSQAKWDESFTHYINQLITTNPTSSDYSDLSSLDVSLADTKIVALGEATHGTKEFFTTKHRLIKYLVEKLDFRVFVIEDGYTLTCNIDAFVSGTDQTKVEKVLSRNWCGAWRTQEVMDLLLWIKRYNSDKNEDDRVRIYGCDMKWYNTTAKNILSELKASEALDLETQETLNFLINHRRSIKMTKKEKADVRLLLERLNNIEGVNNIEEFKFSVRILEQSLDYSWTKNIPYRTILRDKYMAENCQRIFSIENKKKMIIWAHNQHIANHSDISKKRPMGAHLKQTFKNEYCSLGFGFYTGEYWAYNPKVKKNTICKLGLPKEDCIDHLLAMAPYPDYFVDLNNKNLPEEFSSIFTNSSLSRRAGPYFIQDNQARTNYRKCVLAKSYDMLVFIRNTNAVNPLPYTP